MDELGDLVFHDPETGGYVTRDEYLSGNVRRKLDRRARLPGSPPRPQHQRRLKPFSRRTFFPATSTPTSARRGSLTMIRQRFAAGLLGVGRHAIHSPTCRKTRSGRRRRPRRRSRGRQHRGIRDQAHPRPRAHRPGAEPPHAEDLRRIPRPRRQHAAACSTRNRPSPRRRSKGASSSVSRGWIFNDPDRAERLVRIYNDTFNNLRAADLRRLAPDLPRHEPDGEINAAPDSRHLACRQLGQHASRARRRRRQDLRDVRLRR